MRTTPGEVRLSEGRGRAGRTGRSQDVGNTQQSEGPAFQRFALADHAAHPSCLPAAATLPQSTRPQIRATPTHRFLAPAALPSLGGNGSSSGALSVLSTCTLPMLPPETSSPPSHSG